MLPSILLLQVSHNRYATADSLSSLAPALYISTEWIAHKYGAAWAYDFLQTDKASAPGWYIGLLLMHVVFYALAYFIIKGRDRYLYGYCRGAVCVIHPFPFRVRQAKPLIG